MSVKNVTLADDDDDNGTPEESQEKKNKGISHSPRNNTTSQSKDQTTTLPVHSHAQEPSMRPSPQPPQHSVTLAGYGAPLQLLLLLLLARRELRSRHAAQLRLPAFVVARAAGRGLLALHDLGFDNGTRVELAAARVPVDRGEDEDAAQECNGVIHVRRIDGSNRGHDEDDGHEQGPDAGPGVDKIAEFTHVEGARFKAGRNDLAEDGNAIGPVQRDGRDVEDTANGSVRSQPDQIDADAEDRGDPDGEERDLGEAVDTGPDAGEGDETIAREGEKCAAERLLGCEAHKL